MLGNNISMPWSRSIVKNSTLQPPLIMDELNLFDSCIAWYDFTDQFTMYKDNSGLNTIGPDDHIGRIQNKAGAPGRLGQFLRAQTSASEPGDDGGGEAPKFRLNGVNGLSYADFDDNASLQATSGWVSSGTGSNYTISHGGGNGNKLTPNANFYQGNGFYPSPSAGTTVTNKFSNSHTSTNPFDRSKLTFFWVIKPSSSNPTGISGKVHWLLKPVSYIAGEVGRLQETYFEARTNPINDNFTVIHRDDDEGASGTSWSVTGGTVLNSITPLMAVFGSGSNGMYLSTNFSGALDTETIPSKTFDLQSGILCLGKWTIGSINSGGVSDSNYEGEYYELLAYNKALSGSEITQVMMYLLTKYYH